MKIGLLFPGQGAQELGMGKDLYDSFDEYKEVYEKVNEITGLNLEDITFNDEEKLSKTQYTQIAILTMSLAILKLLEKENMNVVASAGLSLGEYSALAYSKAISFEDALKIVKTRGELMQNLCPEGNWSMAAILGSDEQTVCEICKEVKSGFVVPANFNCPGQIVISGEQDGVNEAIEIAKEKGVKRAILLKTAGPFHTVKLEKAAEKLKEELEKISFNDFETKVVKNLDGKEYTKDDDMIDILSKHIISPVRFEDSLKEMINEGCDTFIEIGPGKTLSGFVKKVDKEITVLNINNLDTFNAAIEFLRG